MKDALIFLTVATVIDARLSIDIVELQLLIIISTCRPAPVTTDSYPCKEVDYRSNL